MTRDEFQAKQRKERVRLFNKLVKSKWTRQQIADKFGWTPMYLSHYMTRIRKEGAKPAPLFLNGKHEVGEPVEPRTNDPRAITEHGGGKRGVRGCRCALCLQRRRETGKLNAKARTAANNKEQDTPP